MRCRAGDVAYIVKVPPNGEWEKSRGRVVTLTRIGAPNRQGDVCWEYSGDRICSDDDRWEAISFPDDCLRPIRDPGDDAVDQMLRPLPCEVVA